MIDIPSLQCFGGSGLKGAFVAMTGSAVGVMTGGGGMWGAGIDGGGTLDGLVGGVAAVAGHREEQMVIRAFTCT